MDMNMVQDKFVKELEYGGVKNGNLYNCGAETKKNINLKE
jgi:hypothetical protein